MTPDPLEIAGVVKDYHALRPLRIRDLVVAPGELVALSGLDVQAAEVLTNLIIGATLPDQGTIRVFGIDTSSIPDAEHWLATLDRFAILTDRSALLDGLTLAQNIALPLTLEVEALSADIADRVAALASDAGLARERLTILARDATEADRLRARLARALALSPGTLLAEHPTASIPRNQVDRVVSDLLRAARQRRMSAVVMTVDERLAASLDRRLVLDPATGALKRAGLLSRFARRE